MTRTSQMDLTLTRDIENEETGEWAEVEIKVQVSYLPGDPGRLSGPPEDCYPPEGSEVEVLSATIDGEETELTDAEFDRLCEMADTEYETGFEPDYPEPDYDRDYDDDRADFIYDPYYEP